MKLQKRLSAAADAVRPRAYLADVACDHGLLTAFLIEKGVALRAVASDISENALSGAKKLFSEKGISDRAIALLSDGLDMTDPDVTDIVIAGVGADLMIDIIERASWLKNPEKRLILVPASRHMRLRTYLAANGYATVSEQAVIERGHSYTIIAAEYDGKSRTITPGEAAIGQITDHSEDGARYISSAVARIKKELAGELSSAEPDMDKVERSAAALKEIEERRIKWLTQNR